MNTSTFTRLFLTILLWLSSTSLAWSVPAEIVLLLDTSSSMKETLPGTSMRKIDVAKALAQRIAQTAQKARHRVGLYRFRQQDSVVNTGMGKKTIVSEDPKQCERVGDLLVGVGHDTASEIQRWTDGKHGPGQQEIQALGHSPLLDSVRLIVRYIRARRMFAPQQNCVNAWIVILTDGKDTCSSGGARLQALQELRDVAQKEDIRTLILSFQSSTQLTRTIAQMGREDRSQGKVFGAHEQEAFLKVLSRIEGRLAPEACLLSGVAPQRIGLPQSTQGVGAKQPQGCTGCNTTQTPPTSPPLWLCFLTFWGLLFIRRRKKCHHNVKAITSSVAKTYQRESYHRNRCQLVLLFGFLVGLVCTGCSLRGCSHSPKAPTDSLMEAGPPLQDPAKRVADKQKLQETMIQAVETLRRKKLQPLLRPADIFNRWGAKHASVGKAKACQRLVHSMGFVPYPGVQQGVIGCLATRRCNVWDRALVLQACLKHHGLSATLQKCRYNQLRPKDRNQLLKAAGTQGEEPSTQAIVAKLNQIFVQILKPTAQQEKTLNQVVKSMEKLTASVVKSNIRSVVEKLQPRLKINAAKAQKWVQQQWTRQVRDHLVVQTPKGSYDPVLAQAPSCTLEVGDLTQQALKMKAELWVRYVAHGKWSRKLTRVGQLEWFPYQQGMKPLHLAIVDSSTSSMPKGLPPAARSGCLKGMFAIGKQASTSQTFPILSADEATCGSNTIPPQPGRVLAQVILRSSVRWKGRWMWPLDRVLLDRFGYVRDRRYGLQSGPMYSAKTARHLLPMKVTLWVGQGTPTQATILDQLLASLSKRRQFWKQALSHNLRDQNPSSARSSPPPLPWATLGLVRRLLPQFVPKGMWVLQPRPWRFSTVLRRGFQTQSKRLVVADQTLFDIIDWPLWVVPPSSQAQSAETRLRANLSVGVLLTEAERMAAVMYTGTTRILNTSAMFRNSRAERWLPFPPPSQIARQLPVAVIEAGRQRRRNREILLMTPGPMSFLGEDLIAWWRINRDTGMALGEIRYDGTFYGGIAVAKAVSSFNECLATQAVLALRGARLHPQVKCCMVHAAKTWLEESVDEIVGGAVDSAAVKFLAGVRVGKRMFRAAYKLRDLQQQGEGLEQIKKIINGDQSAAPPCVKLIRDPKGTGGGVKPLELPDDFVYQGQSGAK
ncbi:MAG: VWA domain-containing protein [Deltaproteobacteria bacterium]|nr:MAG: VWA domain-containing protein [Deltaproteobacteria bacterium]